MDSFKKSNTVRLRSRHKKYLYAEEDQCSISQVKYGEKDNASWTVEFKDNKIKLKSCYDCYLTATNVPFLLGWTGKKVMQTKLIDSEVSILWEPVRDGYSVKLKTLDGDYLRANGSIPPWRNSVTHDSTHKQDWFLWEVIPVGEGFPNDAGLLSKNSSFASKSSFTSSTPSLISNTSSFTSNTPFSNQPSLASIDSFAEEPATTVSKPVPKSRVDGRIIHYAVADDDCEIPDEFESEFVFRGDDVKMLTDRLKKETGIEDDLYVCAKNHSTNKLFPLVLQLPPHNAPMYVVVVRASSELAKTLPGVGHKSIGDAEHSYSHSYSFGDE